MQTTAALLHRTLSSQYRQRNETRVENGEDLFSLAESIAIGNEEHRRLEKFWFGIKRVVDSQSLRKPYQRFRDLNDELSRKNRKYRNQLVIRPEHPFKILWDVIMFGLTIYSVVMAFYAIGFNATPSAVVSNFSFFVTAMFGTDILISFNTGYINEETGQFVSDRQKIAAKYFQFWFWIDIVATIPFDIILPLFIGNSTNVAAIRMIRFVRILRIAKIYKVLDKDGFISRLKINPQLLQLMVLLIELFFVAHVFACFWHYLALPDNADFFFENWLDKFGYRQAIESDRYVTSLYFIVVTMLTIGYGDIYPTNQLERIYAIFTMITGVIVFSTLMSKVATLIDKLNPQAKFQAEKIEELKAFLIEIELPRHLQEIAKAEYEYYYDKKVLLEDVGITDLARPMVINLLDDLHHEDIQSLRIFQELKSRVAIYYLVSKWQPFYAVAGDVLYQEGDILRKLICVKTGRIRMSHVIHRSIHKSTKATVGDSTTNSENDSKTQASTSVISGTATLIGGLYDGEFFGEMEYLKSIPSLVHYSAVINCSMFAIDHKVITQLRNEEQLLGEQLTGIFESRYDTMMSLLKDSAMPIAIFQRGIIRFKNLDNGKLEKFLGRSHRKLFINGKKVQCDRFFHDFIEVSEKDGENGLNFCDDGPEAMNREEGITTLTGGSMEIDSEEDENIRKIKVLIPNPLLQRKAAPTESLLRARKHPHQEINNFAANNNAAAEFIVVELPYTVLREQFLIHPSGDLKMIWDVIIAIVVVISVMIIPIQIAFLYQAFPGMDQFNYVIVCFFGVDIMINFRTILESPTEEAFILSPSAIAKHYLQGWFLIDLLSTLPFNVIALFTNLDASTLVAFQLLKFLRLFWLFKLKRLAKTIESFQEYFGISPVVVKLLVLFFKVYFIVHIMACIWWGVTSVISPNPWFTNSGPNGFFYGRLTNVHVSAQYLMSLYFTFTTMSTVGYGDIHQINPAERTLSIPFIIVSATVFGFMLATVSSVMNSLSASESIATDKISLITEYLQEKKCSRDLQDQIIYYFQRHFKEDTGYDLESITARLPDYLANEIYALFYQRKMKKIQCFHFLSNKSVQIYLFRLLRPVFYEANCYVLSEGEELNENLYFVTAGLVRAFRRLKNSHQEAKEKIRAARTKRRSAIKKRKRKSSREEKEVEERDARNTTNPHRLSFSGDNGSYVPVNSSSNGPEIELSIRRQPIEHHTFGNDPQLLDDDDPSSSAVAAPNLEENKDNSETEERTPQNHHNAASSSPSLPRARAPAKEAKIKIQDVFSDYLHQSGKPLANLTGTDFHSLGFVFLGDFLSGDFFGYSSYLENKDLTTVITSSHPFYRPRNHFSLKTGLESSFLVLEKSDLMNLVRTEPLIAMQLQMALAKSICLQENLQGKVMVQQQRRRFIHQVKRHYLKKKLSGYKGCFHTGWSHINRRKPRGLNGKKDSSGSNESIDEDIEEEDDEEKDPSKTLRGRLYQAFSTKYQKVKKIGKRFIDNDPSDPNEVEQEANWKTAPPPTSKRSRRFSATFSASSQSLTAARGRGGSPRAAPQGSKRRSIISLQRFPSNKTIPLNDRLLKRSYSLDDLEVCWKNVNYSMKYSLLSRDFTSNKDEYPSSASFSSSQSGKESQFVENQSEAQEGASPSPPFISRERRLPQRNSSNEGRYTGNTEMILGLDPDYDNNNEEEETSSPHISLKRDQTSPGRQESEEDHNSTSSQGRVSLTSERAVDVAARAAVEVRSRSHSFPFSSYQKWLLDQRKQFRL